MRCLCDGQNLVQAAAFSSSASCSNRNLAEGRHLKVGFVATLAVPNPLFSVVAPLHRTAGMYKHGHLTGLVAGIWQVTKMMIKENTPSTGSDAYLMIHARISLLYVRSGYFYM